MASKLDFLSQLAATSRKCATNAGLHSLWWLGAHGASCRCGGRREQSALPGLSPSERGWLLDLYDSGYADAYALTDQEPGAYTWWPDGDDAGGLRTDTHIISELLVGQVERGAIFDEQAFSHHAPVIIDYDLNL